MLSAQFEAASIGTAFAAFIIAIATWLWGKRQKKELVEVKSEFEDKYYRLCEYSNRLEATVAQVHEYANKLLNDNMRLIEENERIRQKRQEDISGP